MKYIIKDIDGNKIFEGDFFFFDYEYEKGKIERKCGVFFFDEDYLSYKIDSNGDSSGEIIPFDKDKISNLETKAIGGFKEVSKTSTRFFVRDDLQLIITPHTNNKFMVLYNDAHEIKTGEVEFLYKHQIKERFKIDL